MASSAIDGSSEQPACKCTDCTRCTGCYNCTNCIICTTCYNCNNLKNAQYCFENEQLTPEEYFKKLAELKASK